uniref:Ovule protein n=1 Tax=Heterorhabditis bacteriophora TaxID=37862 RepID=A0A1I7WY90_HETBA
MSKCGNTCYGKKTWTPVCDPLFLCISLSRFASACAKVKWWFEALSAIQSITHLTLFPDIALPML